MTKKYKFFLFIIILFFIIFTSTAVYIHNFLKTQIKEDKLIYIEKGVGLNSLINILTKNEILHNRVDKIVFNLIMRIITQNNINIKYGEYLFKQNSTIKNIINNIINNDVHYRTITFPEGLSTHSILKIIEENEFLIGKIPDNIAEGSLLPQTYNFQRGDTKTDLIKRMQDNMTKIIDKYWDNRDKDLPIKTKKEAIILASIVEKETGIEDERKLVASVFINRLKIKMPLQSDPTAIYGYTFGNVSRENEVKTHILIRRPSPYNTYKIRGLPPAPICNPGEESIKAVLNPAKTKYLFFVATGNGGHNFSENYFQHRQMVQDLKKVVYK